MAQSPAEITAADSLGGYLKNWDALSSMLTRGSSFSGEERNCCFLNLGPSEGSLQRFADVSAVSGLDFIEDGRAVIATDWDHDGDLDLWQTNREGPRLRFVKNQLGEARRRQWVAFELAGTTCNRDAIGAVLEVRIGDRKITRSLTAGDGFMSQSGKRIHFGLGDSENASFSVEVRWPGEDSEIFAGIDSGRAFRLTQGSGIARPIEEHLPSPMLPAGEALPAPETEQARIILTNRIPSPSFDYIDFNGELRHHEPDTTGQGRPVLINLWASWCPNCRGELSDFKSHHKELAAKGLRILALTIEGVPQGDENPDLSGAKELVAESSFPFEVGATDGNALRLLTTLHDRVIVRQRPLPLPSSFLIDKWGRLAAIYKGPVDADQLIADLDLLEADAGTIASHAFPFPARDGSMLFPLGPLDFAKSYQEGGDHEAARREARKIIEAPLTENAEADLAARAQAWYFLGTMEQGLRNWKSSAEAYQTALDFSPDQILLMIPLGVSLWQAGQEEEARKAFAEAEAGSVENHALIEALGKAHLQIKQYREAISYFEAALALAPQLVSHRLNLALAHQTAGHSAKAVELYREFLRTDPTSANARNNLALLLATAPDDSVRDGRAALELSREVIAQAGKSHPSPLDTLGTALAETGDFEGAIAATEKALAASRAIGRSDLVPKLRAKLDLYRSGKPYRAAR